MINTVIANRSADQCGNLLNSAVSLFISRYTKETTLLGWSLSWYKTKISNFLNEYVVRNHSSVFGKMLSAMRYNLLRIVQTLPLDV